MHVDRRDQEIVDTTESEEIVDEKYFQLGNIAFVAVSNQSAAMEARMSPSAM
jgi:hypothetical protein